MDGDGWRWMEMDGDYNQNITTELRWTYLEEPNLKTRPVFE